MNLNGNSNYAYATFAKEISETDMTNEGKLVQLNHPYQKGEINLMSAREFETLQGYFPDRVKGKVVKQKDLMATLKFCWTQLSSDVDSLSQMDSETQMRLDSFNNEYVVGGKLSPVDTTVEATNDLASKFITLQERVREAQRSNANKSTRHAK